jgi:N-acetylneuraminate lyase
MAKQIQGGVWPAVLTCLDDKFQPCEKNITKIVELFVSQKVGGLFVLGSTGQGPALNQATRQRVAELTLKANAGRLPVMVHVGAVSPHEAADLARHAADHGADAISSVAPIYFGAPADVLFAHYHHIASATRLPFYPYHFNAANLPPIREYVQRLLEIPNIAGMKVTDQNLYTLELILAFSQGKLTIFSGADELVIPAAAAGAHGAIGSTYNLFAPAVIAMRQRFLKGEVEAARHFMLTFARVIHAMIVDYGAFQPMIRMAMRLKYDVEIGASATSLGLVDRKLDEGKLLALVDEVNHAAGL